MSKMLILIIKKHPQVFKMYNLTSNLSGKWDLAKNNVFRFIHTCEKPLKIEQTDEDRNEYLGNIRIFWDTDFWLEL